MGFITYGELIGVFSSVYGRDSGARLDIGTRAMKRDTPASTLSSTTKLRIQRIGGVSEGDVEDTHIIGIFSEDLEYRLDVGTGSMKENVPTTALGWGAKLKIWPAENKGSRSGERINYNDIIGVFSSDGLYRLDIGGDALDPAEATRVTWATQLLIQDTDPVVKVNKVVSLTYNLEMAVQHPPHDKGHYSGTQDNETNVEQTITLSQEIETSNSMCFSNAVSFEAGVSVSAEVGIPFVGGANVEVSAKTSISEEWGSTIETTKTETWEEPFTVEPRSKLNWFLKISDTKFEVPYVMVADVETFSGNFERRTMPGTFIGHNATHTTVKYELTDQNGKIKGGSKTTITAL
jgi:hypothetical protein